MSPQPEPVGAVSWLLTQKKKKIDWRWRVERERLNRIQLNVSSSPLCLAEDSVSCENPGLPDNGYQIMSKSLYLPGQSLTFVCYQGYELIGEVAIKCILGNPSFWSGPLPLCRGETFAETFFRGMCFVCVDWQPPLTVKPSFSLWTIGTMHVHNVPQKKDIISPLGCMLAQ